MSVFNRVRLRSWSAAVAPAGRDDASLDVRERHHGRAHEVAHLVGEDAEPLGPLVGNRSLSPRRKRAHGARDGVVEAEVERLELLGRDGCLLLDGEPRDDLTEVAVVVDDLRDGRALVKEGIAMVAGASLNLAVVDALHAARLAQGLAELIEERREPLRQLGFGRDGRVSLGRRAGSPDAEALRDARR